MDGASSSPTVNAPDPRVPERRHHLRVELAWTAVILVAFTALEVWLEHTTFGHRLELEAHRWFQSLVEHRAAGKESPVVIVDIGNLKLRPFEVWSISNNAPVRRELEFTPREELQTLLEAIATSRPAGIGFDLDLSPERDLQPGPMLALATSNLLERALAISTNGVPVVFGVGRGLTLGPSGWLGNERFSGLAGTIQRRRGVVRQAPSGVLFAGRLLPSLGKALADGFRVGAEHGPPRGLGWAISLVATECPDREVPGFEWRQFYVNYSALSSFRRNLVSHEKVLRGAPQELEERFRGKLVIVGDASMHQPGDTVMIPGQDEPLPGVFVHACATHTLVQAPLWRLNPWVGSALAFALSLLSAWAIFEICWAVAARHPVSTIPLTVLLSVVACVAVVALAWLFMLGRIMWLEVFLTVAVVIAHCLVAVFVFSASWPRLKGGPGRLAEALVVAPQTGDNLRTES